jgi:hypothetical protein
MRWFKRWFGPHKVVISEPFEGSGCCAYVFGNQHNFQVREFVNIVEAQKHYEAVLLGLELGFPEVSIRVIKINPQQARALALGRTWYHKLTQ